MDLTPELKAQIDQKSHYQLLHKIRFGKFDDPMMGGESGHYWMERRGVLRDEDPEQAVRDSKSMGW